MASVKHLILLNLFYCGSIWFLKSGNLYILKVHKYNITLSMLNCNSSKPSLFFTTLPSALYAKRSVLPHSGRQTWSPVPLIYDFFRWWHTLLRLCPHFLRGGDQSSDHHCHADSQSDAPRGAPVLLIGLLLLVLICLLAIHLQHGLSCEQLGRVGRWIPGWDSRLPRLCGLLRSSAWHPVRVQSPLPPDAAPLSSSFATVPISASPGCGVTHSSTSPSGELHPQHPVRGAPASARQVAEVPRRASPHRVPEARSRRASTGGVSTRRGLLPAGCRQYGAATYLCISGDSSHSLLSR